MQHEGPAVFARQIVDDLLVLTGAQRGDHDGLGFTTGEQGRTVGPRQHADFGGDRTNRLGVATVDTIARIQDIAADDVAFQLLQDTAQGSPDQILVQAFVGGQLFGDLGFDGADLFLALLLDGFLIGVTQPGFGQSLDLFGQRLLAFRLGRNVERLLGTGFGQFDDRLDHVLVGLVAEHHRAQHVVFRQFVGFGFDHQHAFVGAGDDQVQLGIGHLVQGRVEDEFTVDQADAAARDRAQERRAGNAQRGRGADHGGDVGVVFQVVGQNRADDLNFVLEAVGEQRADRTVDQARGQNLVFAGTAFTLEETTGDLARGIGLFNVVNGQGEEIDARTLGLFGNHGAEHLGLAIRGDNGAVGLAGDFAGFQGQLAPTPVNFLTKLLKHIFSTLPTNVRGTGHSRRPRTSRPLDRRHPAGRSDPEAFSRRLPRQLGKTAEKRRHPYLGRLRRTSNAFKDARLQTIRRRQAGADNLLSAGYPGA